MRELVPSTPQTSSCVYPKLSLPCHAKEATATQAYVMALMREKEYFMWRHKGNIGSPEQWNVSPLFPCKYFFRIDWL